MKKQEIRAEIDALDAQITALFCQRMALCKQIGCIKRAKDLPLLDSEREAQVLENVAEKAGAEMAEYTRRLYNEVLTISREYQKTDKSIFPFYSNHSHLH